MPILELVHQTELYSGAENENKRKKFRHYERYRVQVVWQFAQNTQP